MFLGHALALEFAVLVAVASQLVLQALQQRLERGSLPVLWLALPLPMSDTRAAFLLGDRWTDPPESVVSSSLCMCGGNPRSVCHMLTSTSVSISRVSFMEWRRSPVSATYMN